MSGEGSGSSARPESDRKATEEASPPLEGYELRSVKFELAVPDLRNGALASIQQAAVRAGMQALYHWPHIQKMLPETAVDAAEHSFRAHVVSLQDGFGVDITAAQTVENRKWAIVLAGVRAGATAAWRIGAGDVTMKEMKTSGMEVVSGRIVMASSGSTATPKWTAARQVEDMTQLEMEVLAMCAYIGMAVPILQGASLISTGHHYVPSTYKMFEGLKKQALGAASKDVMDWVVALGPRFDDLAFHKACHPISPNLKRELAAMPEVAQKLGASGHGSAAIRLPAIPSEASGGKACLALIRASSQVIKDMGDTISANKGHELMMRLEEAKMGQERATACDAVVAWVQDNEKTLAFCAGIVQQIHDTTGSGKSTILSAYSIKKLMQSNPAEVAKGTTYARASTQRARDAMERGEYKLGGIDM